jgi:hypothetical protein
MEILAKILEVTGILLTNSGVIGMARVSHMEQIFRNFIRSMPIHIATLSGNLEYRSRRIDIETLFTKWIYASIAIFFVIILTNFLSFMIFKIIVWIVIFIYVPIGFFLMAAMSGLLPEFLKAIIYYSVKILITPYTVIDKISEHYHLEGPILILGILFSIIAAVLK